MKKTKKERKKKRFRRFVLLSLAGAAGYAAYTKFMKPPASPCTCAPEDRLKLEDEENLSGVGLVMENMVGGYLQDPDKVRILNGINLKIAIEPIEEPESAITMTFSNGCVTIAPGVAPDRDMKLACDYDVLMELPKMGAGLQTVQYLMTPEGQEVVKKFMSGQIKVEGLLHAPEVLKLSMFLAVSPGG